MRFLIDAQLPKRMVDWLIGAGNDATHTLDLPDRNRSTDQQVIDYADRELRVVVTKDSDYVDSHLLSGRPAKLCLVSTGNITNMELGALIVPLIPDLVRDFQTIRFSKWTVWAL